MANGPSDWLARHRPTRATITTMVLSDTHEVGHGNRGIYVDDRRYDLGEGNAGMLIFVEGRRRPEYVPWTDVEQVDFHRPQAMYPPLDSR